MDVRFGRHEQDDDGSSLDSQPGSPTQHGSSSKITKATSYKFSSHRKSSKAMQRRVVSIPVKDCEGTRFKGEGAPPPSDLWAWRKYGQKPIKGSPYPRGYYRCSSSKGCPARKQVERSRDDPTMLVITYSCDHNHPWPAPKNNHHSHNNHNFATATTTNHEEEKPKKRKGHLSPDPKPKEKATDLLPEGSGLGSRWLYEADELGRFMEMQTTPSTILEGQTFGEGYYHHHQSDIKKHERKTSIGDEDLTTFFPTREEDESLFSDLGELPESAVLFSPGKTMGPLRYAEKFPWP